jgi:KUP system potassium uptake protein
MTVTTSQQNQVSGGRNGAARRKVGFWALTLGSIGVVYGDIGTSPLYALRESVVAAVGPGNPANETVVLGILSLIIWALILIVTVSTS